MQLLGSHSAPKLRLAEASESWNTNVPPRKSARDLPVLFEPVNPVLRPWPIEPLRGYEVIDHGAAWFGGRSAIDVPDVLPKIPDPRIARSEMITDVVTPADPIEILYQTDR